VTPLERYKADLQRTDFQPDETQQMAVLKLQGLYAALVERDRVRPGLFQRLFGSKPKAPRGLYFWGGVGRGKTYLMDTFFEALPIDKKMRAHFHRFMKRVHADLREFDGATDPLELVADRIAGEAQVICFDEFFVSDITDAMILGTLMQALFDRGVVLVATSNIVPDRLYENGLQRSRFVPAINALIANCEVVNVDAGVDYRLRSLSQAEIYHSPLDEFADDALRTAFSALAGEHVEVHEGGAIEVEGRMINVHARTHNVLWVDFLDICDGPRSQNDYIEIAKEYFAVVVGDVPQLDGYKDDQARRFINMVDEFYDRNVKLIISAEVGLEDLYVGGNLRFEFQRTNSRLLEMQSHEYLEREHKA